MPLDEKGLKIDKLTYVATLIDIKLGKHIEVSYKVVPVLNNYRDVISSELPM